MNTESSDAKTFWGTTDFQQRTYAKAAPFYIRALVRVLKTMQPGSVLEFGCNAGRNLELLRSVLPQSTAIRGFDVNRQSVEFGKQNWKLDLETSDESYFSRQPDNSVDVIFTVSVLDHLPEIDDCLKEIMRVMAGAFVMIEPYPDSSGNYLSSFKQEGILPDSITTETPFSYTHDYYRLMPNYGYLNVLDIPLPPYDANLGPLYRLSIFTKERPRKEKPMEWRELRDAIVFDAMLDNLKTHGHMKRNEQLSLEKKLEQQIRQSKSWQQKADAAQRALATSQEEIGILQRQAQRSAVEIDVLRKQARSSRDQLRAVQDSVRYRLASHTIQALKRPGLESLALPWRCLTVLRDAWKNRR